MAQSVKCWRRAGHVCGRQRFDFRLCPLLFINKTQLVPNKFDPLLRLFGSPHKSDVLQWLFPHTNGHYF